MKVAIMQPYFLPYIGYWQLIASVDTFVLLDDVNYINRGWINRNQIIVNGKPFWLTLPLQGASQNRLICDLDLVDKPEWRPAMKQVVSQAYHKAPYFEENYSSFQEALSKACGNLSVFLADYISKTAKRLGISTKILPTSRIFPKDGIKGQARIIDICKRVGATQYVNLPGGKNLYEPSAFRDEGMDLYFLDSPVASVQMRSSSEDGAFVSILDTLMLNSITSVKAFICENRTTQEASS